MFGRKWLAIPAVLVLIVIIALSSRGGAPERVLVAVEERPFKVDVRTVGELEAARSLTISASLRGDQAKIIDLIADGTTVKEGDILVRLDPTPYEEKLEVLTLKIEEQEGSIEGLKQTLIAERLQFEKEKRAAEFEVESAELELRKVRDGDGPLEEGRLKAALQKAATKYEELGQYSDEIIKLRKAGLLNPAEVHAAAKKLTEAEEEFKAAELQFSTYMERVWPMQLKRAENAVRKASMMAAEGEKAAQIRILRAESAAVAAEKALVALRYQEREMRRMLEATIVRAPSPGMAVLRRQHFQGQRRPARSGDSVHVTTPLIDLPDLSEMVVNSKVREVDLHRINSGTPVTIHIDAYPGLVLNGTVTSIGVLAMSEVTQNQRKEKYFGVTCSVSTTDTPLRPGMTARVIIHVEPERNALTVPVHAIRREGGKTYCEVEGSRGAQKREVKIGSCNTQFGEVLSGLKAGEKVALLRGET